MVLGVSDATLGLLELVLVVDNWALTVAFSGPVAPIGFRTDCRARPPRWKLPGLVRLSEVMADLIAGLCAVVAVAGAEGLLGAAGRADGRDLEVAGRRLALGLAAGRK